ncbi:MAG: hypothetical protein PVG50_04305 [Thiohalophilus sp.]|jgi:hypothetical protein
MNESWIDIIPPPAPAPDTTIWLWGVLAFMLCLSLYFIYQRRESVIQHRRLQRLQRELSRHNIAPRQAGFLLAGILRQYHATSRLDRLVFSEHQSRWQRFLNELQQTQYSSKSPPQAEMEKILDQAREWLRR